MSDNTTTYSLSWLRRFIDESYYETLKSVVHKRHKLIEPKCGCYGKRLYNKVKHRTEIGLLEQEIDSIIRGLTEEELIELDLKYA